MTDANNRSPWNSSKYPSADRASILPSARKEPAQTLDEATKYFDRSELAPKVDAAERERLQVVERFPLETWPTLPVERYALGTVNSSDSFCWWLEFGTPHMASIRGGSALKHMIFKRKGEGKGWYFEKKYRSLDDAWEHVRAGFVEALCQWPCRSPHWWP